MNVNDRNRLFLMGDIEREDLWPKISEYESQAIKFRFHFGLDELPREPGIILIRGPRQYGKSTWLELELKDTLRKFGPGSAFFLNGDEISSSDELESRILEVTNLFSSKSKIRRLFIDEITGIDRWELALKRLVDRGELVDVLVVTTGSRATDIRRGAERLPGRKGKLKRTDYVFAGISYKDFYTQCHESLGDSTWIAFLLSGGSPIAAKELWQFERIPEYFIEINRDWLIGEIVRSGRSRQFFLPLLRAIEQKAPSRMGYLNLARAAGLANNTVAAGYIEQLSDLLAVLPFFQWDANKRIPLQKMPCKFGFINLCAAIAFSSHRLRSVHDFEQLPATEKGKWCEWLVAQELFRRQCIRGTENPESIFYWSGKDHEIDFVDADENFYEVKFGETSPLEFAWFSKLFPSKRLFVVSQSEFQTKWIKGVTFDQFLLADGFRHPYPGLVDDENIYNDVLDFS